MSKLQKCLEGASFYVVLPLNVNIYSLKISTLLSSLFIFSFPFKVLKHLYGNVHSSMKPAVI